LLASSISLGTLSYSIQKSLQWLWLYHQPLARGYAIFFSEWESVLLTYCSPQLHSSGFSNKSLSCGRGQQNPELLGSSEICYEILCCRDSSGHETGAKVKGLE
jgi:hypothetical protein